MPAKASFNYAIVRVTPCVEREEFINAGVILFCRTHRFLEARIELDLARLQALAPQADVAAIQKNLALIPAICGGAGPIGQLDLTERFHWLVSPRSTIIQVSPVHAGLCDDPHATLAHLFETMVQTR